jgi:acyl-coenzyme A synthetase/AMP-(fatty) acid ligase
MQITDRATIVGRRVDFDRPERLAVVTKVAEAAVIGVKHPKGRAAAAGDRAQEGAVGDRNPGVHARQDRQLVMPDEVVFVDEIPYRHRKIQKTVRGTFRE